jgi:hypothetical protein
MRGVLQVCPVFQCCEDTGSSLGSPRAKHHTAAFCREGDTPTLYIRSYRKFHNTNCVVDKMLGTPRYFACQIVWADNDELSPDGFNDAEHQAHNKYGVCCVSHWGQHSSVTACSLHLSHYSDIWSL